MPATAEAPRVLVVSACSKRKAKGNCALDLVGDTLPARELYTGRAHVRIRKAIDRWRASDAREAVVWSIMSAGCGLVGEHSELQAYEATFNRLGSGSASQLGRDLGIPRALQEQLADFHVALFVLPLVYLHAAGAPFHRPRTQLYFTSPAFGSRHQSAPIVPCGLTQARELHVTSREVGAARFSAFVDEVILDGLSTALRAWGSAGEVT